MSNIKTLSPIALEFAKRVVALAKKRADDPQEEYDNVTVFCSRRELGLDK